MGLLKNRYTITRGILEDRDPPLLEHHFIVLHVTLLRR